MDKGTLVRACGAFTFMLAILMFWATPVAAQVTPPPLAIPNLQLSGGGIINAIARRPNGGVPRGNIARLAPDGTLDPDWNPSAGKYGVGAGRG